MCIKTWIRPLITAVPKTKIWLFLGHIFYFSFFHFICSTKFMISLTPYRFKRDASCMMYPFFYIPAHALRKFPAYRALRNHILLPLYSEKSLENWDFISFISLKTFSISLASIAFLSVKWFGALKRTKKSYQFQLFRALSFITTLSHLLSTDPQFQLGSVTILIRSLNFTAKLSSGSHSFQTFQIVFRSRRFSFQTHILFHDPNMYFYHSWSIFCSGLT